MARIELIGLDRAELTDKQQALIAKCHRVVASGRHRVLLGKGAPEVIAIAPVKSMLVQVAKALDQGDVAILASGDPLLYGIGKTLIETFGPDQVRIHPALSAVQLACARFILPWHDLPLLSLHGRSLDEVAGRVLRHQRILLFTDHLNSPDRVASILLETLERCGDTQRAKGIRLRVAENLGLAEERLIVGDLATIGGQRFAPLNMLLVEQPAQPSSCRYGLGEGEICHSRGLITKDEVRAVVLHQLRLPAQGVFWDIGGGSGAISIEAARLCPDLVIRTVERNTEQLANIRRNICQYGAYNVVPIPGEAPDALAALPDPDRVFIGGSGGQLAAIVDAAVARLAPGGRVVISAVLDRTAQQAPGLLAAAGCRVSCRRLQVDRWSWPDETHRQLNPITLFTGVR